MSGSWWVEIVFLAMLAGFIALRLVSVLGRRTGQEGPVGDVYRNPAPEPAVGAGAAADLRARGPIEVPADVAPDVASGLRAIATTDPSFEPTRFAEGAKAAYAMILEAFWRGDIAEVDQFVADDVADGFRRSIASRDGKAVANRVVAVESAQLVHAALEGNMAEVTVKFDARLAGDDGEARVGDEWTFRRHVTAADPNWLLVATEAEG